MKFDKNKGLWKPKEKTLDDYIEDAKRLAGVLDEDDDKEDEEDPDYIPGELNPQKKIKGKCVLTIRFDDEYDYSKWLEYNPGRKWEFIVNFPAFMRAEYIFNNSLDVEAMTKKIVQLLSMGFDVHSASWKLEEKEESSCGKTEE